MDVFGLPVPFLGTSGQVQVLLTAVGLRLPSAFQTLHSIVAHLTDTLELDVRSVAPEFFNILGHVSFNISVCESSDALRFLLGLSDPLSPHLDFHVIVGAAIAESQQELIECTCAFDTIVQESISPAVPCLFVFTSSTFDGSCLPGCATQIPSDSSEQDVARRVREGFVRCAMEFLISVRNKCDDYKLNDDFESQLKLGSWAYMFGGTDLAINYYETVARSRPSGNVAANLLQVRLLSGDLQFDVCGLDHDVGPVDVVGLSSDALASVAAALKTNDPFVQIRAFLRAAHREPETARQLILRALAIIETKKDRLPRQLLHYYQLCLLLLLYSKNERTFLFHTSLYFDTFNSCPPFLLQIFADRVTRGDDWCEQRIEPAAKLVLSSNVPRAIKNKVMSYLLSQVHRITATEKQRELLAMIPSGMEVDANSLIEIKTFEAEDSASPIQKAQMKSNVFIYSPLRAGQETRRCAVGDTLGFALKIANPLTVPITFDTISLLATNAIVYPLVYTLPKKRTMTFRLALKAKEVGELSVTGFTFTSGNLTSRYELPVPITIEVIDNLPLLTVKRSAVFDTCIIKNSNVVMPFTLVNTSSVDIHMKGITFGPIPPVLTSTSLPIVYPPAVEPPLPDVLKPGMMYDFCLKFHADETNSTVSFAIEYGSDDFSRRFEMNQSVEIVSGPRIRNVQVIPLDDHDDFETNSVTLLTIVENPLAIPVSVTRSGSSEVTVIEPLSLGTFVIEVERVKLDPGCATDVVGKDHVRKCEAVATREKQAVLSASEKEAIRSTLLLKENLQRQLELQWELPNGITGTLPFTHVTIDGGTLALLQPPPFTVSFSFEKFKQEIWSVTCSIEAESPICVKASLCFSSPTSTVLIAGAEENLVTTPGSFTTYVHCDTGSLRVVGHFHIGDVFFIRCASFDLS